MMGPGLAHLELAPRMAGSFPGLGIGALMFFLFVAVVGLVVWLLYKAASPKTTPVALAGAATAAPPLASADAAMLIVRERLARGEIDAHEYDKLTTLLARTT